MELNPNLELRIVFYRPNPFPFGTERRYIENDIELRWLKAADKAKKLGCYFHGIHKGVNLQCRDLAVGQKILLDIGETAIKFVAELGAGECLGKLLKELDNERKEAMDKYYEMEAIAEELRNKFAISWTSIDGKRGNYKMELKDEL